MAFTICEAKKMTDYLDSVVRKITRRNQCKDQSLLKGLNLCVLNI